MKLYVDQGLQKDQDTKSKKSRNKKMKSFPYIGIHLRVTFSKNYFFLTSKFALSFGDELLSTAYGIGSTSTHLLDRDMSNFPTMTINCNPPFWMFGKLKLS